MKKSLLTVLSLSLLQSIPMVQANSITSSEETLTFSKKDIKSHFQPSKRPIAKNLAVAILTTASIVPWGFGAVMFFRTRESGNTKDLAWTSTLTVGTLLMGLAAFQEFRKIHTDCKYNKNLKNNKLSPLEKANTSSIHPSSLSNSSIAKNLVLGTLKLLPFLLLGGIVTHDLSNKLTGKTYNPAEWMFISLCGLSGALLGYSGFNDISQGVSKLSYRKNLKKQ
jgi:hypothetical protein